MQGVRKDIIRYALDFDIDNVNTYSGYKGDLIVKITTKDREAAVAIRRFALSQDVKEVVIKQNVEMKSFDLFCVTGDTAVYQLKAEDILMEVHSEHPADDPWGGAREK